MRTGPEDSNSNLDQECMLDPIDLPKPGSIDWDALGYSCRAPFFDAGTKAQKKAKKREAGGGVTLRLWSPFVGRWA